MAPPGLFRGGIVPPVSREIQKRTCASAQVLDFVGGPRGIRTPDLGIKSPFFHGYDVIRVASLCQFRPYFTGFSNSGLSLPGTGWYTVLGVRVELRQGDVDENQDHQEVPERD